MLISFINPTAKERIFDQTLIDMNLSSEKKIEKQGTIIFSVQHTHHYITAFRMFIDNKILGVGVKNFRNFCNYEKYKVSIFSCSTHPHNSYIQVLSETGIIGFTFLIFTLFYFCKNILRHIYLKFKGKYLFNDFEICIVGYRNILVAIYTYRKCI